ncbi:FIG040338: Glycosyl transferase, partial [hydrothermal vent metagenome]
LVKQLARVPDIRLTVILLNHGTLERELVNNNISVFVINERKLNSIVILHKLFLLLRRIGPDIVHTHRIKENILGSIAARLSGVRHSVRTVHGASEHRPHWWKIWKHVYRYADLFCGKFLQSKIIAVSPELNIRLQDDFGGRVVTIENGVDIEAIHIPSTQQLIIPGKETATRICIVCRLVPVKRVDIFIEVANILINELGEQVEFYIFGDGPLRDECNMLIKKRVLSSHVHMMGFKDNITAWLAKMDLLMITSDHEGLPMNLLEAMSLKVPVISHAVGGIPEVLGRGDYGLLVSEQNIDSYVAEIKKYLKNPDVVFEKAEKGYEFIIENYTAEKNSNAYLKLYRNMTK